MSDVKLQIAGNKAVASLGRGLAKISEFAHDYAGAYSDVGAVVKMPVLSCTAALFDATSNNYEQSTVANEASIVLSSQYVAGFKVTPMQMSDGLGAFNGLFNQMGEQAGRSIAKAVEGVVVGQVLSSSTALTATLTATKSGFCSLYKECMENDLDPSNCVLVLNPENYAKLLEVLGADVVNLERVIEQGYVDNFLGFKRVLGSAGVDSNIKGFIAEYGAIGVAGRRVPLLDGFPVYEEYIDEATGLPVTLVGHQTFKDGSYYITATSLFGTGILDANHLIALL